MDIAVTGSSGLDRDGTAGGAAPRRAPGDPGGPARERGHRRQPPLGPGRGRDRRRRLRRARRGRAPGRRGHRRQALDPRAEAARAREPHRYRRRCWPRRSPGSTKPPAVLVSGSAIGWYGNRGAEVLTEASAAPTEPDFLSDVCGSGRPRPRRPKRPASAPCTSAPASCSRPRAACSSACVAPFRLGLGGRIGSGRQYMSWIALDDEIGAILHALDPPRDLRAAERDRADPGDERRAHRDARPGAQAPDGAPDAGPGAEARVRQRAGPAPPARGPAGAAGPARGYGLLVRPPRPRVRARGSS